MNPLNPSVLLLDFLVLYSSGIIGTCVDTFELFFVTAFWETLCLPWSCSNPTIVVSTILYNPVPVVPHCILSEIIVSLIVSSLPVFLLFGELNISALIITFLRCHSYEVIFFEYGKSLEKIADWSHFSEQEVLNSRLFLVISSEVYGPFAICVKKSKHISNLEDAQNTIILEVMNI